MTSRDVTPIPKAPKKKKRPGLAFMSERRRGEMAERREVCAAVRLRDGFDCRAKGLLPGPCGGLLDVHEIIPRSAWPAGWLVVANCVAVCRQHHQWIDNHPAEAAAAGFHGFSFDRARVEPTGEAK